MRRHTSEHAPHEHRCGSCHTEWTCANPYCPEPEQTDCGGCAYLAISEWVEDVFEPQPMLAAKEDW